MMMIITTTTSNQTSHLVGVEYNQDKATNNQCLPPFNIKGKELTKSPALEYNQDDLLLDKYDELMNDYENFKNIIRQFRDGIKKVIIQMNLLRIYQEEFDKENKREQFNFDDDQDMISLCILIKKMLQCRSFMNDLVRSSL